MPTIPTAAEIKARIVADIETEIGQTSPALPKSWNGVIAGAVAGVIVLLYQGDIVGIPSDFIFPETADYAALILLGKPWYRFIRLNAIRR